MIHRTLRLLVLIFIRISGTILSQFRIITGLPHTRGNSDNFQVIENLSEAQGILILFSNSGKLQAVLVFSKNFKEIKKKLKISGNFFLDLE